MFQGLTCEVPGAGKAQLVAGSGWSWARVSPPWGRGGRRRGSEHGRGFLWGLLGPPRAFLQEDGRIPAMSENHLLFCGGENNLDGARVDGIGQEVSRHLRTTKMAVMGMRKSQRPLKIILSARVGQSDSSSRTWVTKLLHCEFRNSKITSLEIAFLVMYYLRVTRTTDFL